MSQLNPNWNKDPFYTHQPFLKFYAEKCKGPILELGCGEGSTPLLHEICSNKGIQIVTMENNSEWMSRYNKYISPSHRFLSVKDNGGADEWIKTFQDHSLDQIAWGLVFVDQSPWEARHASMDFFKDKTDVMMIHDMDYFPESNTFGKVIRKTTRDNPGEYDFSEQFRKFKMYFPPSPWCSNSGPPTFVGTQKEDVTLYDIIIL